MAGGITRGDVRICRFGPPAKARPVVVLTRNDATSYLATVTVAPISSSIRGVPSQVILSEDDGMKTPCAVNLHNVTTVRCDRLGARIAHLSQSRLDEICSALRFALGCNESP